MRAQLMANMVARLLVCGWDPDDGSPPLGIVVLDLQRTMDVRRTVMLAATLCRERFGNEDRLDAMLRSVQFVRCDSLAQMGCALLELRERVVAQPTVPRMLFVDGLSHVFWHSRHVAHVRNSAALPQNRCVDLLPSVMKLLAHTLHLSGSNVTAVVTRLHMFGASKSDDGSKFLGSQWRSLVSTRLNVEQARQHSCVWSCARLTQRRSILDTC